MAKKEVEFCRKIVIWELLRDVAKTTAIFSVTYTWVNLDYGPVKITVNFPKHNILLEHVDIYQHKEQKYFVQIVTTTCHLGGKRYWFICPNFTCNSRVAIIYENSPIFTCRKCSRLTYTSQKRNRSLKNGSLTGHIDIEFKSDKLWDRKFTKFYKGKHTRKYRRILKVDKQLRLSSEIFLSENLI